MKVIVVIPTYNESENISRLIEKLLILPLNLEILVVDDFSPDGTYKIIEELSKKNEHIHLLLRTENRGRGFAGIDGFKKAIEMGSDIIIEMDGDLSHDPKYIPKFLKEINDVDIVIGSRYIQGGKDKERSIIRKYISKFARRYISIILGININDPTSGYRAFKKEVISSILPYLNAKDPFIVTEVLFYAFRKRFRVKEVPIEFMERGFGKSKLKTKTLIKYLFKVLWLKLRFLFS